MRDGRQLASDLRSARKHVNNGWAEQLAEASTHILEFVSSPAQTCRWTGLRLMDIWRYFRHTWSNQYTSTPGRTMLFLVRDAAAYNHPVVGLGALSSPVMQIRERDMWIGWHPESFIAGARANPTTEIARWLIRTVQLAIRGTYKDDFIRRRILSKGDLLAPTAAAIGRLIQEGKEQRAIHHRFARSRDHKQKGSGAQGAKHWISRAQTHLFRSKRALALATYLEARATS